MLPLHARALSVDLSKPMFSRAPDYQSILQIEGIYYSNDFVFLPLFPVKLTDHSNGHFVRNLIDIILETRRFVPTLDNGKRMNLQGTSPHPPYYAASVGTTVSSPTGRAAGRWPVPPRSTCRAGLCLPCCSTSVWLSPTRGQAVPPTPAVASGSIACRSTTRADLPIDDPSLHAFGCAGGAFHAGDLAGRVTSAMEHTS